jgi:hypothetical protein
MRSTYDTPNDESDSSLMSGAVLTALVILAGVFVAVAFTQIHLD